MTKQINSNADGGLRRRSVRGAATIRGERRAVTICFGAGEKEKLDTISARSNLSCASVLRAMILMHANDTIHVEQVVSVSAASAVTDGEVGR